MCEFEIIDENNSEVITTIVPAFETSLFNPVFDTSMDYIELGIDSLLKDGVLKDIPIVGSLIGAGKFVYNIADRNFLKQTINFINEFNRQTIAPDKLESYRQKLHSNPKKLEAELGRVLITINRNVDTLKSIIESRFYSAYIDSQIDWNDFCELCDITERLFMSDIAALQTAYANHGVTTTMEISYKHDRLISIGLLTNDARLNGSVNIIDLDSNEPTYLMTLTSIGLKYCQLAF